MNSFGKIVGFNLAALVAYSLIIRALSVRSGSHNDQSMDIAIASAIAVALHVIACLIVMIGAFASDRGDTGRTWLATAAVVLVVGFSVCLGNASL